MTVPRPFHQPCIAWPYGVPVRSCVRACQGGPLSLWEVRGRGRQTVQGPQSSPDSSESDSPDGRPSGFDEPYHDSL